MAFVRRPVRTVAPKHVKPAASGTPDMTLPTKKSIPVTALQEYVTLLYGAKKIGKTTLAAQFDSALFLMFEAGGKALSIFQMPVRTWAQAMGITNKLLTDTRFKTVVIDTVDLAFKACETAVCKRMGIDHPSEGEWGRGYSAVRDEFVRWLGALASTGKGVVLISHATEREIKTKSGRKYDRIQPTMSGQARDIVEGFVDIWAYYDYDDDRRILTIRGDDHILAGHRLDGRFMYKGKEVRTIDMGQSPAEAYANFLAAFNNQYRVASDDTVPASATVAVRKKA